MSMDNSGVAAPGLVDRAKAIITAPRAEWAKIAGEPVDIAKLYTGYLLPLVLISAVAMAIGWSIFGLGGFGFSVKLPIATVLSMAVMQVISGVIGVYVFALILNWLAPQFGSVADINQAHKLAVYSSTAGALAGIFQIYPALGVLGLLGIYSLVLLYLGMPALMKTPNDKRVGYFVCSIIAAIVLGIVFSVVLGAVRSAFGPVGFGAVGGAPSGDAKVEGKVTLPNGNSVDLSEMEKFAKQMEAAQKDGKPMPFKTAVSSGLSIGTPGVVRLLETVHRAHGKLPWARLFEPAIKLSEQGFQVSSRLNFLLRWFGTDAFDPAARRYFFDAGGSARPKGYLLKNPEYAATLRAIAAT